MKIPVLAGSDFRYCGQEIFYSLFYHPMFERALKKHVPQKVISNIQPKLDSLRAKVS